MAEFAIGDRVWDTREQSAAHIASVTVVPATRDHGKVEQICMNYTHGPAAGMFGLTFSADVDLTHID